MNYKYFKCNLILLFPDIITRRNERLNHKRRRNSFYLYILNKDESHFTKCVICPFCPCSKNEQKYWCFLFLFLLLFLGWRRHTFWQPASTTTNACCCCCCSCSPSSVSPSSNSVTSCCRQYRSITRDINAAREIKYKC